MSLDGCNKELSYCLQALRLKQNLPETISSHLSKALQELAKEDYFSAPVLEPTQVQNIARFFQYLYAISNLIKKKNLQLEESTPVAARGEIIFVPNVAAGVNRLFVKLDECVSDVPKESFLKTVLNNFRGINFIASAETHLSTVKNFIEGSIRKIELTNYPLEESQYFNY